MTQEDKVNCGTRRLWQKFVEPTRSVVFRAESALFQIRRFAVRRLAVETSSSNGLNPKAPLGERRRLTSKFIDSGANRDEERVAAAAISRQSSPSRRRILKPNASRRTVPGMRRLRFAGDEAASLGHPRLLLGTFTTVSAHDKHACQRCQRMRTPRGERAENPSSTLRVAANARAPLECWQRSRRSPQCSSWRHGAAEEWESGEGRRSPRPFGGRRRKNLQ